MKKKTARQKLVNQLDKITREIVLLRDGECICPPPSTGHSKVLQCGHLISRGKHSVRWDLYNTHVQCSSCNLTHEHYPHYYTLTFIEKFSKVEYEALCRRSDVVEKIYIHELAELLEQMQKILEKQKVAKELGKEFKPYFSQKNILSGAWVNK